MDTNAANEGVMLPHWATGLATSVFEVGAMLPTRDGRRVGNAVTVEVLEAKGDRSRSVRVVTDAGTDLVLSAEECDELFYPPQFINNIESHLGVAQFRKRPA